MTTRRRNVLILCGVVALAVVAAFFLAPAARERAAVEAIPSGAFLVVTVDLARLRSSPLGHEIGALREVSDVSEQCGFDPLARAKTIAIGVPEKPDGVFGIALTHDLGKDDLAKCAQRVMSERSATPHITERGSWTVIEQEGILAEATRAKIAYRDGAPLLIARGDYLATMQAALDGTTTRASDAEGHARLRKIAIDHAHGSPLLVATALLPKSVRDRLKQEAESDPETAKGSPTMSAVLAVESVAISVSGSGDSLDLFIELGCETAAACEVMRDFLDRKRKTIASKPGARLIGLGILDALQLETRGSALDATLEAPESEVARALRAIWSVAFTPQSPAPGFSAPR